MAATTHRVGLVACGKAKLNHRATARDLYIGSLFRAASAYAEDSYDEWWILSARHHLVHPDTVLKPYDETMSGKQAWQRERWAMLVERGLRRRAGLAHRMNEGQHVELYLHAGQAYREPLLPRLASWPAATVHVPLDGLRIGQQLRWYAQRRSGT